MAYSESTIGGSTGSSYRVWVNSIRTRNGTATENFEEWRAEGGINKLSGSVSAYNGYNNSTFNLQLGLNGVSASGNFNYNFSWGSTGTVFSRGTTTTRVYRNSAGVGYGFTSRMDVNLQNSPYLTTGWVQSSDSLQTKYRHASLTGLSMDAGRIPATDEGPLWLEFSNPSGTAVDAWIELNGTRVSDNPNVSSRFNFSGLNGGALSTSLQQVTPNSNKAVMRIGIHDSQGGDHWDYRDRTYTIKNDNGQADPTFSDFEYSDVNAVAVAVTGDDQVLVQGISSLVVTVTDANKATTNKHANRNKYNFTIGGYSQSSAWPETGSVVHTVGSVADVTGVQTLSVRAIDTRGNSKNVSKNVNVLPYERPGFYAGLKVKYKNDFDNSDGIDVTLLNNTIIGAISPMTLNGVDKNEVIPTVGLRFDMAHANNGYTGTWVNIPFVQTPGTGEVSISKTDLEAAILNKMNTIGADNTERWYIVFQIGDKFSTQFITAAIDVGRPFFRIGADGRLYYKEIEFFETFSGFCDRYYSSIQAYGQTGSWVRAGVSNAIGGWTYITNTSDSLGDTWVCDLYMPAGIYRLVFFFLAGPEGAQVDMKVGSSMISHEPTPGTQSQVYDLYAPNFSEKIFNSVQIAVNDGVTYRLESTVIGRNPSNTTGYSSRLVGVQAQRLGNV